MEHLFDWLKNPGGLIDYVIWRQFQQNLSGIVELTVILAVVAILIGYAVSARTLRIQTPGDVFKSYTPMYWLLLSFAAGLVAGIVCYNQLSFLIRFGDKISISLEVFFITAAASALLAYLLILLAPGLTPKRFKYRPAAFLHRGKSTA